MQVTALAAPPPAECALLDLPALTQSQQHPIVRLARDDRGVESDVAHIQIHSNYILVGQASMPVPCVWQNPRGITVPGILVIPQPAAEFAKDVHRDDRLLGVNSMISAPPEAALAAPPDL